MNATTTGGAITLGNAGNIFNTANLTTGGSDNATLYDASALTIAGANVGGTLAVSGGSTIGQSGAIHAASLSATTINGAITLTNTGNTFANASLNTSGSDNASLYDASALNISGATVGGNLALSGGSTIRQSGAIHAASLNVTTTNGAITLTNTGNTFGPATLSTAGSDNASLYDASALTIASANIGGTLTLSGGSTIGQTGAIHASALSATTTNGAITLTNIGNTFGAVTLATGGADNASLYDAVDMSVASATVGGALNLSGGGAIGQTGAIQATALNVTTNGGAITLTNAANSFGTATLATAGTGNASLADATNLVIASAAIGGDLTLSGGGSIGQTGAIHAGALNVTTTGGPITLTNTANTFGPASLATSGSDNASLYDANDLVIANANIGGTLTLAGGGAIGQTGAIHAAALNATTTHGAITLTNSGNIFATATLATSGADNVSLTDASNLTIASATIGGDLTLAGGGSIGQTGAIYAHNLNVTTTGGAIMLTNAANAFDTATLATSGSDNASLTDAQALTLSLIHI